MRLAIQIAVSVLNQRAAVLLSAPLAFAFACAGPEITPLAQDDPIRVSVLPEVSEDQLRDEYGPLFDYLADTTGRTIEPVFYPTYGEMLDAFIAGDLDLALFGGYTFVVAQAEARAEPLVMRDIDTRFKTYFIAKSDTPHHVVEDFQGAVFAFGSELSTSGHLMPREHLTENSIVPETFFGEVRYSGKHDTTAYWVRDGDVALGAVNAVVFDAMVADGQLEREEFKIVCQSRRFADYVWAVRAGIGDPTRIALMDAFLDLIPQKSPGREILAKLQAGYFVPARRSDFESLALAVKDLGTLDSESAT